jgi:hypothetical protein
MTPPSCHQTQGQDRVRRIYFKKAAQAKYMLTKKSFHLIFNPNSAELRENSFPTRNQIGLARD